MSKHTPGPWVAHQLPSEPLECGHHVTTHDGLTVCNVVYQLPVMIKGQIVEATRIANSRLIAASPELYAVLKELQESAAYWSEYDVPLGIVDRINQAIAKAEQS